MINPESRGKSDGGGAAHSSTAEAILVRLAQAGDRGAFDELLLRRQGPLRAMLLRLCDSPAAADDVAQQAFLKAWSRIGSLRAAGAFAGWLRSIAVRLWIAEKRKREPLTGTTSELDGSESARAEHPGAAMDIDRCLAQLSGPERLCIVLSYQDGLSHGEIAETTQMPLGTVKSHITRGTQKLRRGLADYARLSPSAEPRKDGDDK
jgi:RNA polymerase sigma factor (sigma-70 family)